MRNKKKIYIQTKRFTIKPLDSFAANEKYLGWLNDTESVRFLKTIPSEKYSLTKLKEYLESKINSKLVEFLGIYVNQDDHIGNIKYEPIKAGQYAIMGILVGDRNWQGRGVASEILPIVNLKICQIYELKRIILGVEYENKAAIKAYTKCGFLESPGNDVLQHDDLGMIMEWYP